jgi:drug/metabolite transporter (DMT)-like permease
LAAVHIAVVLFGLSGLLGKAMAAAPLMIVFGRTLLAAGILGLVWLCRRENWGSWSGRRAGSLAVSGAVLALHWLAFFQAVQVSTVAVGVLAYASFPLFVTFLEPLFLPEPWRARDVAAALAVAGGLALMTPTFHWENRFTQGVVWGLLSALAFAVLVVWNRRLVQGMPPLKIAAAQNAWAACWLAPLVIGGGCSLGARDLALLGVLGVLCTAVAHLLFVRGLARVRAQTASIIAGLEPVYAVGFALVFLKEVPTPRTLLGGALILAAVLVVILARPGHESPSPSGHRYA